MRYWKCVSGSDFDFKIGKIYESEDNNKNVKDETEFLWDNTDINYTGFGKFEEVPYEDFILQEFTSCRIAIALKNENAVEYWSEKLIKACDENGVKNDWEFTVTCDDSDDCYYIENNIVFNRGKYSVKRVILEAINKKEDEEEEESTEMNKEFTNKSLANGMVVELRNGSLYLVHEEYLFNSNGKNNLDLPDYDEDLTDWDDNHFDIMKVFKSNACILNEMFMEDNLELIWERKEDGLEKQYTFRDITIEPNGRSYEDEDECDPIYISKSEDWDEDQAIAITVDEAEFLIESLTEIVANLKK